MVNKPTIEDGRMAMMDHAKNQGMDLYQKYGPSMTDETVYKILEDRNLVRFETSVEYNSKPLSEGFFATCEPKGKEAEEGYVISIHKFFEGREGCLASLVFYHLVTVNYGEFADFEVAETFASEALGMEREKYYRNLCSMVDAIPKK